MTDDQTQYPPQQFPVIFADGITSAASGNGVVKFYLQRIDPHFTGKGGISVANFVQVVMPLPGFVAAVIFFQKQLEDMVKKGIIQQSNIDEMMKAWPKDAE